MRKANYIYKNKDGEYFKSVEHAGKIVLSNPSYPFFFLFEVQEPLTEIGEAEKFGHLVRKENHQFYEGNTLNVKVNKKGSLKIVKNHETT